ncbi:MAG: phosphate signaling complex protein PhoU [Litorivicinaceae bacterium]|jgi:phosphate transport system protein|nr:phosphate signaling complex protein PhoU [Litorivicinaceae bacterium]MDP5329061.1 phosphate signaling complex protein PhoU [Litorivicinaceae bacterium]MDP5330837.1 phosphate signaling complex protein PhoU [Litorivicinaceae bacterium]MDP5341165.1 phosphate signaling complex protein PhoU [Litorivicinaceae bacterium]MDP5342360.1 phosphate signaling complex protein PhoU [Litorivicinaceae bacterium]
MGDLREDFTRHISSEFNDELEELCSDLLKMGGLAERQVQLALQAQEQFDSELVKQIKETEKSVNAWEIRIDELVAEIIARRQPTASDLRLVLAVSKIVRDLERAGDEANKVAYMAQQAAESPRFSTVGAIEVRAIGERVAGMLSDALTAFARLDVDMALQVARNDKDVDAIYQSALRSLATFMIEDPREIGNVLNVMWVLRALERIGDHATNVAEHIVYLVKGTDIRHRTVTDVDAQTRSIN